MKVQRNIGAVLTVAMLGSIFAGCGSSAGSTGATATQSASTASTETAEAAQSAGSTASAEGGDSTTGYQVTGSMTYNMFMRNTYVTWIKDQKWYDEAEKRTGVKVNYVEGPDEFDDCYAEIDQRVTSHLSFSLHLFCWHQRWRVPFAGEGDLLAEGV